MHNPHFFQKCCHFRWNQNKVSENDNTFERNEDCATVFLKWTDFRFFFSNLIRIQVWHEKSIKSRLLQSGLRERSFFTVSKVNVSNPDLHTSKPCSKVRAVVKTFLRKYLTLDRRINLVVLGVPVPYKLDIAVQSPPKELFS